MTVWTYTSDANALVRRLRPSVTSVYWTGDEVIDPLEPRLLAVTDHVFAVSPAALAQKRKVVGDRARLMPMAIDPSPYERAARTPKVPPDLAGLPRPIFGYGGAINHRLDRELVARLADRTTGSVVLVGPVSDAAAKLNRERPYPPNVHLLGHRDEDVAPHYVTAFDVGLIPYELSAFNLGSNPVKTYQYLAAGLPVVATRLPSLEPLAPMVTLAADSEAFVAAALQAADDDGADFEARVALAHQHSYDALIKRIDAVLEPT